MVLYLHMSVNVISLYLESNNADEKSKSGLIIFSFRQPHYYPKAYKISSLSPGFRNFAKMWSDLFLFLEFCPLQNCEPFQSENFFSSVKSFFCFFFHNCIFSINSFFFSGTSMIPILELLDVPSIHHSFPLDFLYFVIFFRDVDSVSIYMFRSLIFLFCIVHFLFCPS